MAHGRRQQRLLLLSPAPSTPYVEQLRIGIGRRALAICLALLIEALLLFMLFSFSPEKSPGRKEGRVHVMRLEAVDVALESEEPARPEEKPADPPATAPQPEPDQPPQPAPSQPAPPLPPQPLPPIQPPPTATPIERPAAPAPRPSPTPPANAPVYGPPNKGTASTPDTQRVGTAPNGEPLYAAAWYREPRNDELRGYLSTASGPGWGLIACRTAPDYRVEDCVGLDEYPMGSQITRAVLAAAWQFRVRPPRVGGKPMIGAWVRIRIDYSLRQR